MPLAPAGGVRQPRNHRNNAREDILPGAYCSFRVRYKELLSGCLRGPAIPLHAYAKGELIRLNAWEGLLGSQSRLRQPKTHTEDTLRSPRWYPPVRRVALDRLDRATFPTFLRRRGLGAILVRSPFAPWGCVHGGFVHSAYLDAVPVVLTVVILTLFLMELTWRGAHHNRRVS